jgi:putative peptidoglycan lipid II flippase
VTPARPPGRLAALLGSDGGAAGLVAACSILSTVLGLAREIVTGRMFGATENTDAFFAAFTLVSFAFYLFAGGAVQQALMPSYQKRMEEGAMAEAADLLRWAAGLVFVLTALCTTCLFVFAETLVRLVFPGFDESTIRSAASLTRVLCPVVVLAPLGNLGQSVLHSRRRFLLPAMIPPLSNLVVIAAILALGGALGVASLAIGYGLGYSLWLVLVVAVIGQFRPFARAETGVDRAVVAKAFGFLAFLVVFDQLSGLVQRSLLSQFEPGLISAFTFATRIAGLPVGILAGALATVLFPRLVTSAGRLSGAPGWDLVLFGIVVTLALVCPAALYLCLESRLVVSVLFGSGAFSGQAIANTSLILLVYAASLPAQAMVLYLGKVYVAAGQTSKLVAISVAAGAIQILLTYLFPPVMGWLGVPAATFTYAYIHTAMLLLWMGRFVHGEQGSTIGTLRSLMAISAALALAGLLWLLPLPETIASGLLRGLMMLAVYAGALFALGERSVLRLFKQDQ